LAIDEAIGAVTSRMSTMRMQSLPAKMAPSLNANRRE